MTDPNPQEMQERLDELGDDIEEARRRAEDHGTLPDSEPKQTFADPDGDGDPHEAAPGAITG